MIRSAQACLAPFAGVRPVMPVFSSGQWAAQTLDLYRELRSTDLMHLAGGGTFTRTYVDQALLSVVREDMRRNTLSRLFHFCPLPSVVSP